MSPTRIDTGRDTEQPQVFYLWYFRKRSLCGRLWTNSCRCDSECLSNHLVLVRWFAIGRCPSIHHRASGFRINNPFTIGCCLDVFLVGSKEKATGNPYLATRDSRHQPEPCISDEMALATQSESSSPHFPQAVVKTTSVSFVFYLHPHEY